MSDHDNYDYLEGCRIRLVAMPNDSDPVPAGTTGTIFFSSYFDQALCVTVDWDINRSLNLICPPDRFQILSEE